MTAIKRNLEKIIENAFVSTIGSATNIGSVPVRHWESSDNGKVYPIVLVYCESPTNDNIDATRQGDIFDTNISITAMTYIPNDRSRGILYDTIGVIRDAMASSSLLTTLKTATNNALNFYCAISSSTNAQYNTNNVNMVSLTYQVKVQVL